MELRKDYLLNRWVVIAEDRGKRPLQFIDGKANINTESCVFCPGNESLTPPELLSVDKNGKWKIRVITNKFSAVDPEGSNSIQTHNQYYTFGGDHGHHEVIIETSDHNKQFGELSAEEIAEIMQIYAKRIQALEDDKGAKYVCLFKNQGKEAGASIKHPHSQLVSFSMMPPVVAEKLDAMKRYPWCPYCDIIRREKDSSRRCFENNSCIAFAPYASRFNYETWIFPKSHIKSFLDFNESLFLDFAKILKEVTKKVESLGVSYNLEWYYAPNGDDLHFHVEVTPRIAIWAGFEIGFGVEINTVSPEQAARFYRGEA
jgi:UDPglucose--hexose-1-phosphate uridylyltransferase